MSDRPNQADLDSAVVWAHKTLDKVRKSKMSPTESPSLAARAILFLHAENKRLRADADYLNSELSDTERVLLVLKAERDRIAEALRFIASGKYHLGGYNDEACGGCSCAEGAAENALGAIKSKEAV